MPIAELFLIAVSLSMDAFALSVCQGLAEQKLNLKTAATMGLWFGGFQFLMPVLGWLLGSRFTDLIQSVDHWVAFLLLGFIGANMLKEAHENRKSGGSCPPAELSPRTLLALAVATSIDALAVGVTFAFLEVHVLPASAFIGLVTFVICFFGVLAGHRLGAGLGDNAKTVGGIILILIGVRILLADLFLASP